MPDPILSVRALKKRFGGLLALSDVGFSVSEGEIFGVIGPNGAGKTTLFSCLVGALSPTSGSILFRGREIAGLPNYAVVSRGLVRTHQIVRPFRDMTVEANVSIGAHFGAGKRRGADARRRVAEILERTGLGARAGSLAMSLPIGDLKRLEIARALATEPSVLCLDEVMGGLNPSEIVAAMSLIRALRDSGLTVLMIEHHVNAVAGVTDRVLVLNFGEKIAEGPPRDVLRQPDVVAAYLGDDAGGGVTLLSVESLDVFYGDVQAVRKVAFTVEEGEVFTIIGANGAGKSTTLRSVAGLLAPRSGRVAFDGKDVTGRSANTLAAAGIVLVPEGRQLWPAMTVLENLRMGAYPKHARARANATLEEIFAMFPVLERRVGQKAGTLSGGEQQMCAIGRGLMTQPRLLLLDEPALGLSPLLVREVFASLRAIRARGVTIVLVEQNVPHALALADRACVLETGRVTLTGTAAELLADNRVRDGYLGYGSV